MIEPDLAESLDLDISVVRFDDTAFSEMLGLTTVADPSYEMGRTAASLLIDLISYSTPKPRQVVLRPSLVIRDTCMRPSEIGTLMKHTINRPQSFFRYK